jgi:DNA replication and repair protein RecF
MHLRHLSLTNYRNYGRLELELPTGPILLHGNNAQGKTNLLEAIYYLATTRSPHTNHDQQLLNWDADVEGEPIVVGRLKGEVIGNAGNLTHTELRLIREAKGFGNPGFRREALVNRRKVRLMDLLGTLRVVLFLPEDLQIITGSPANRRRYLDITLCQVDNAYCRALSAYNKVLDQRNALLRQIGDSGHGHDLLPIYSEKLVKWGSEIFRKRAKHISLLAHETQRIHYEHLTNRQETIRLTYLPRLENGSTRRYTLAELNKPIETAQWLQAEENVQAIQQRFEKSLNNNLTKDIAQHTTTIGPHRDDWSLWVNGRALSHYGSRGQQRSGMLGLKLAEIEWMYSQTGDMPLLLLDEVVAELDERRRKLLLDVIQKANQAIVTATDPGMFTANFLENARALQVVRGIITA